MKIDTSELEAALDAVSSAKTGEAFDAAMAQYDRAVKELRRRLVDRGYQS